MVIIKKVNKIYIFSFPGYLLSLKLVGMIFVEVHFVALPHDLAAASIISSYVSNELNCQ